jgi:hypothetical protein
MSSEPAAEINARLAAAERLLASARMVGDDGEHRLWRSSRDLWVALTSKALASHLDGNIAWSFEQAVKTAPGQDGVAEDLPHEQEALRNGMAVLIGAREQLAPAGSSKPPEIDRRKGRRLGP